MNELVSNVKKTSSLKSEINYMVVDLPIKVFVHKNWSRSLGTTSGITYPLIHLGAPSLAAPFRPAYWHNSVEEF